jgi:hypothetical protein
VTTPIAPGTDQRATTVFRAGSIRSSRPSTCGVVHAEPNPYVASYGAIPTGIAFSRLCVFAETRLIVFEFVSSIQREPAP